MDPIYFHGDGPLKEVANTTIIAFKKVTWNITVFVPYTSKGSDGWKVLSTNPYLTLAYFNYTVFMGIDKVGQWFYQRNLAMPRCQNVLGAALYVAIMRKHPDVMIFGADHSWHEELRLNEDNELIGRQLHFYDNSKKVSYIKLKDHDLNSVSSIFLSLHKAFYAYEQLKRFADKNNVQIINASERSFIDVFKKVKL